MLIIISDIKCSGLVPSGSGGPQRILIPISLMVVNGLTDLFSKKILFLESMAIWPNSIILTLKTDLEKLNLCNKCLIKIQKIKINAELEFKNYNKKIFIFNELKGKKRRQLKLKKNLH